VSLALAVHTLEQPNHPQKREAGRSKGERECPGCLKPCAFYRLETSR
jgi:hypothetical protein